ncbi:Lipoamide acyltransferase component of branched-chain alpha-keto acid dehydrogenase complex [Neochlamydia sp. AcF65]|uniref:dihydrolipoamide acetyltransferase family protein n=1 Tax=Neochlamydia sp. AcF65 TaxID=2795735 RepID=UPI001BC908DC|nr:dihydrolipoamide acetyltransferase family protein [Neochlamydia sp. AcF65]MBS4166893.1 Lipoamide acyltransferase component of branched-chain alpha-keto acid dehydrogenase complex [Neochlamydia sp. AcF65]
MAKIHTVTLPDIGEGVIEGEVVEWLKDVQDTVLQDEPVVIVMTDKATVELPSPYPGKIAKHYYKPGEISIKGKPLYDIELLEGHTAVPAPQSRLKESSLPKPCPLPPLAPSHMSAPALAPGSSNILALPSTRKLAQEMGIDICQVQGMGKAGRVRPEDLRQYVRPWPKENLDTPVLRLEGDKELPIIGIKNLMYQKMVESKRKIPHFSYFEKAEATRLVRLRQKFKEEGAKKNIQVTYMPFLLKALSLTLNKFPQFNSSVDQHKLIIHQHHHIGIAMASPLGLIVPVLKNVQALSLIDLIYAYEELKNRANTNKLQPSEMKEGTITISNFGVLGDGGLWATPIINYPEVAILAVNRIQKQPWACNNEVVLRDVLNLSWSFDHRIIDGDQAAAFSHYCAHLIKNPAPLL